MAAIFNKVCPIYGSTDIVLSQIYTYRFRRRWFDFICFASPYQCQPCPKNPVSVRLYFFTFILHFSTIFEWPDCRSPKPCPQSNLTIVLESLVLFILGYGIINPKWRREEEMDDKCIFCLFRFLQYFQTQKKGCTRTETGDTWQPAHREVHRAFLTFQHWKIQLLRQAVDIYLYMVRII